MDLWCACWFWPADELDCAPLPTTFTEPGPKTRAVVERVAARMRFFHWELEFPDVFREEGAGFHAMLGNPPWDIAKPKSQEFFSSIDPLYRSYGKQEALRRQTGYFGEDQENERSWLGYNARFRGQSNFVTCAASPFGDPEENDQSDRRFYLRKGNLGLHDTWRQTRSRSRSYADSDHSFRHQGSADLNLYKLFLEQAHALLAIGGRLGFLVPSGLYSDKGTGSLRDLFLERCRWEWLFGFENRAKLFPIDSRFKFNPVIVQKGGATAALRTVFMRRDLGDWEQAEEIAVPYSLDQVKQFSPKSCAILEIESQRDLEILEKIYANSVLLGDEGPDGWGIRYATEFHMTNDSKLFPPRPQWEAKGYRPDEYSRWLLGNWRPIDELWAELGVDPDNPEPAAIELEDWLYDFEVDLERRVAERTFIHGHLLAPGDVDATGWKVRCAQPPYDRLPVSRVAIPEGIMLSREADAWIDENEIKDVALPLYEGRMIGQFDLSQKGWVSGKGRSAVWRDIPWERKQIEPQYLMAEEDYISSGKSVPRPKIAYMRVSSSTNSRSTIATYLGSHPAGDSVFYFVPSDDDPEVATVIASIFSTVAFDFVIRARLSGLNMSEFVMVDAALPQPLQNLTQAILEPAVALCHTGPSSAIERLRLAAGGPLPGVALPPVARLDRVAAINAMVAASFGLRRDDLNYMLRGCDEMEPAGLAPKGFWRVDKHRPPELRQTVLTQIAFADLQRHIEAAGGDREAGIQAFMTQNQGEGWLVPETLRLADYDLGHDDRAREHQPVATELGPRFYDWQLVQTTEEAHRETHLHARNLLGKHGYRRLVADIEQNAAKKRRSTIARSPSQVAEERHRWDDWLSRSGGEAGPGPSGNAGKQPDLFE